MSTDEVLNSREAAVAEREKRLQERNERIKALEQEIVRKKERSRRGKAQKTDSSASADIPVERDRFLGGG
jgi:hypothetical protein